MGIIYFQINHENKQAQRGHHLTSLPETIYPPQHTSQIPRTSTLNRLNISQLLPQKSDFHSADAQRPQTQIINSKHYRPIQSTTPPRLADHRHRSEKQ